MTVLRSLFFVPGNNKRFIQKAKSLQSDIICFDLEDSVPENQKETARELIHNELQITQYKQQVYVRINTLKSNNAYADLSKILNSKINGIVIPKVDTVAELKIIEKYVSQFESDQKINPIKFIPSIESAQGVINSYAIASSSKRIYALIFGIFDLLNNLGVNYIPKLGLMNFARQKIPIDAKAAGVFSIDSIWQDLGDMNGFIKDCIIGRDLGYSGKSIIHPSQLHAAYDIFKPNDNEIKWAQEVYAAYLESTKHGMGTIKLNDKMIDEVHYKMAKSLLESTGKL
ncbi:MAG: CoA ester lyase [Thaumarchaeota archaeon]|nr:CoA ester lyase [Nitrososphaerota archaeon]